MALDANQGNATPAQAHDYRFSVPVGSIDLDREGKIPKRITEGGKLFP
jgi:hypothetical protein